MILPACTCFFPPDQLKPYISKPSISIYRPAYPPTQRRIITRGDAGPAFPDIISRSDAQILRICLIMNKFQMLCMAS